MIQMRCIIRSLSIFSIIVLLASGCSATNAPQQQVMVNDSGGRQPTITLTAPVQLTPTATVDMKTAARGYWVTIAGDQTFAEYPGKIYFYNWYAIEPDTATTMLIKWDTGLTCDLTPMSIHGNELRGTAGNVKVTVVIHTATTATATFQQDTTTYTKQLQKQRDDPTFVCD